MIGAIARGAMAMAGSGTAKNLGRGALIAGGAGIAYSMVKSAVPRLEDEVTVEVLGQPGAKKQQLYYLALSTAFGLVQRFDAKIAGNFLSPPAGFLMVEYDAADHWVRATVKFNTGLLAAAVTGSSGTGGAITGGIIGGVLGGFAGPGGAFVGSLIGGLIGESIHRQISDYQAGVKQSNDFYSQAVVYSGPKDEVIGGAFNFTGALTPAIPTSSTAPGAPKLPFEGKVILTTQPSIPNANGGSMIPTPNPKPPGDNRSRGTKAEPASQNDPGLDSANSNHLIRKLIPLVYAALTDPGSDALQVFPMPQSGAGGV